MVKFLFEFKCIIYDLGGIIKNRIKDPESQAASPATPLVAHEKTQILKMVHAGKLKLVEQ